MKLTAAQRRDRGSGRCTQVLCLASDVAQAATRLAPRLRPRRLFWIPLVTPPCAQEGSHGMRGRWMRRLLRMETRRTVCL